MSDLIRRKDVIKLVNQFVFGVRKEQIYEAKKTFIKYIEKMPTAYDVDKVIEEFKTDTSVKLYGSLNSGNYMIPIDRAVEIVKQGGVADDVCEWEKGSSGYVGYPAYYSKCCTTNSKGLEMQTHIISDWKYCPYCGKKIKVVE